MCLSLSLSLCVCVSVRAAVIFNCCCYSMRCLVQVLVSVVLSLYVVRLAQREFNKMSQENTEKPQVVVL